MQEENGQSKEEADVEMPPPSEPSSTAKLPATIDGFFSKKDSSATIGLETEGGVPAASDKPNGQPIDSPGKTSAMASKESSEEKTQSKPRSAQVGSPEPLQPTRI